MSTNFTGPTAFSERDKRRKASRQAFDQSSGVTDIRKIALAVLALFATLPLALLAHALTCMQQAQVCARIAKQKGQPEYAPKCLASARIAACRQTCVWTQTNGSQYPASGDCKAR
jgi:hypothetical protein